ncbi:MAG: glycoside hydrolase family 2 [Prevotella sp.]|nr:glycoside hydrolase family 2 [Prevotella sp.]
MTRRFLLSFVICHLSFSIAAQETERLYLSGHGCDDMVQWDFKCTDGRGSGQWTKIGVPSCWELQGFGTYQYGMRFYGKATPEGIADEHGLYKTEFTLPQEWQGRQIELVFEAVFTEARVQINGRKAGAGTYQGGFTRHTIDISDRVFFGNKKNRLEVEVLKESTNPQVNMAERRADYWNFSGIWRPVFIVAKPMQNIQRVAVNAGMDGRFQADVFLNRSLSASSVCVDIIDTKGKKAATSPAFPISSDNAHIDFIVNNPQLWTAETPNLYTAVFTLKSATGQVLHVERQRFGFRTIEYRHSFTGVGLPYPHVEGCDDDGVFINGHKVIMKGVNRHSFRPETGRTLSKAKNIEDVELIKSMNMNAVRLSHYPADPEFLDACDSLGLYVECELPGWHWAHETVVGTQIAEEMVTRDVNHPSIIFWSNGNEGGFNYELEPVFTRLDPQQRVVLYPWSNRNGFETKHYRSWGETADFMRQKEIFMPTEFLHGLYDGGHGAGLKDYWDLMMSNPRCAGGFLWDLMDQAVLRTDLVPGGSPAAAPQILDPVGNFGSDGIVGPHMEKEGSFYTIREVWSPIEVKDFSGGDGNVNFDIINHYDFTSLNDCRLTYRFLNLPGYEQADVTVVTEGTISSNFQHRYYPQPGGLSHLHVNDGSPMGRSNFFELTATDPRGMEVMKWVFPLINTVGGDGMVGDDQMSTTETDSLLTVSSCGHQYVFSKLTGRLMDVTVGSRHYSFGNGPRFVAAKRADRSQDGFYNHDDREAFQKKTQYTEYADQGAFDGFSVIGSEVVARYRHGSLQWVSYSFGGDSTLYIHCQYNFNGVVDLMGICFDYPEQKVRSKQWVGLGPYRVWQNRMQGPQLGYWQNDYNDPIPGESWQYPEFKGYFGNVYWMRLFTDEGSFVIMPEYKGLEFLGVYEPRDGRDHLLYDLPHTGIAVLDVIPAVRNKVNTTDLNGPSAQPATVFGERQSGLVLRFE